MFDTITIARIEARRHRPALLGARPRPLLRGASARGRDRQGGVRWLPVRHECLSGAIDRREPYGVWGGQLVVLGAVVARKRPRGRPRKEAA